MPISKDSNDESLLYLAALGARVAAESGRAADRHHLGRLVLRSLRDDPGFLHQIDGATGERERAGSVLARSVLCALALRRLGLGVGDVVSILAPNHIHIAVPIYASMFLGLAVSPVDRTLKFEELTSQFLLTKPKVVFCQSNVAPDVQRALNAADLNAFIVTFDGGDYQCSLQQFIGQTAGDNDDDVQNFSATDFNPDETLAFLTPTSGTTGMPKVTASTHKNFAIAMPYILHLYVDFPLESKTALVVSPLQWLTATFTILYTPLYRVTRLQTSANCDKDHCYDLINKYRPSLAISSPTFMRSLVIAEDRDGCDFTCLEFLMLGGNAVTKELLELVKEVSPDTVVFNAFGMSECSGFAFLNDNHEVPWAVGRPVRALQHRLVHPDTHEDITEPNVSGELWVKGESMCKGYYNSPEATKEAFTEDGWFKTGDMFYKDDKNLYHFVERMKLMMKYMNYQISPAELEQVLSAHPGVAAAAVGSVSDAAAGDLPVAFVVRHAGAHVTAQEIKDHVKERLSDAKQLRGGVVFVSEIPTTSTGKLHRRKLKEMAESMDKE